MIIREMTKEDYDGVYSLWESIKGFAMRSLDDDRDHITSFLARNPKTSVVAEENGTIIGAILCGQDGRRGTFYHVCVDCNHRKKGIGTKMVEASLSALKEVGITKANLIAFTANEVGNEFWSRNGWKRRGDLNYYDLVLDESNEVKFNR